MARTSYLLRQSQGVYLGAHRDSYALVDKVEATRFPTDILARRISDAVVGKFQSQPFEVIHDPRPPLVSISPACRECGYTRDFQLDGCSFVESSLCSVCAAAKSGAMAKVSA